MNVHSEFFALVLHGSHLTIGYKASGYKAMSLIRPHFPLSSSGLISNIYCTGPRYSMQPSAVFGRHSSSFLFISVGRLLPILSRGGHGCQTCSCCAPCPCCDRRPRCGHRCETGCGTFEQIGTYFKIFQRSSSFQTLQTFHFQTSQTVQFFMRVKPFKILKLSNLFWKL